MAPPVPHSPLPSDAVRRWPKGCPMRSSLRSQLYRAARDMGNVQAASKGPGSYAKRVARRKVYRTTDGITRHLLRSFGL
jgi:hypothetical protein